MLEIYLTGTITHNDLTTFFNWLDILGLPFEVKQAPIVPKKLISSYVEASHNQTGIWNLPLPNGHLRILLSRDKHIGPQNGECLDNKMVVACEDVQMLKYLAMHEIGHALKAVDTKKDVIVKIKSKPEFSKDASSEKIQLIKRLEVIHPDGLIEMGGLHCLRPGCVMQPIISQELLETTDVKKLFCPECRDRFFKYLEELKDLANEVDTCEYCCDLHECMYSDGKVWEDSVVCKKFRPLPKQQQKPV